MTERLPAPPRAPSDYSDLLSAYHEQDKRIAQYEAAGKQSRARLAVLLTLVSLLSPLCIEAIKAYRAGPEPAPEVRQADVDRIDRTLDRLAERATRDADKCDARVSPLESDVRQVQRFIDERTPKDTAKIPWQVRP